MNADTPRRGVLHSALGARVVRGALFLLLTALALGCTLNPADGSRIPFASNQVTFSGWIAQANSPIVLEAQTSSSAWQEIGRTTSGATKYNTTGQTPLYAYSLAQVVPQAYWREVTTSAGAREYRATLRMRVGGDSTYTFTSSGQSCVSATAAARTETDMVAIGRKCTTGNTISLIAGALRPALPPVSIPPVVALPRLAGATDCQAGAADCNPCANNVKAQLDAMWSTVNEPFFASNWWTFQTHVRYPPNLLPSEAFRKGHVQGFTRTNSATFPFAGVYSGSEPTTPRGAVFFLSPETPSQLRALHPTTSVHPTGLSVIGKYVAFADGNDVRLFDVERATSTQNLSFRPGEPGDPDRSNDDGISTGGGGLALTKLASGKHLLVVHTGGSLKATPREIRFWELSGPLERPTEIEYLGQWEYVQDRSLGQPSFGSDYRFSENLSLVTECGTRKLYVVTVTGANASEDDGTGYFLLSEINYNNGKPSLTPLRVYPHSQNRLHCMLRAAGGVFVHPNHELELYCSGYNTTSTEHPSGQSAYSTFRRRL